MIRQNSYMMMNIEIRQGKMITGSSLVSQLGYPVLWVDLSLNYR